MFKIIFIRIFQVIEALKRKELKKKILNYFYSEVVPVEKELKNISKASNQKMNELQLVIKEIFPHEYNPRKYNFSEKSREYKTEIYLKKGYKGLFILDDDNNVLGNTWYAANESIKTHRDIELLHLKTDSKCVYLFDLYISDKIRGGHISTDFMNNALYYLQQNGYSKAYGYYEADNFSSLWIHRLLGFRELSHYIWKKNLFTRKSFLIEENSSA